MAGGYWVTVPDDVMAGDPQWPAGVTLVGNVGVMRPGHRLWFFEDEDRIPAGQEFDAELVHDEDGTLKIRIGKRVK